MNFPSINTLRTKEFKLNGKSIILKPWTNLQLTNFESLSESYNGYKFALISEQLIHPNIECKVPLTLIEEKAILNELYKMSKSNLLDVIFTCEECKNKSNFTINLEKSIKYVPLSSRVIKTSDVTFNLQMYSTYRMDLDKNINDETLRYIASFIDSFEYKGKTYEVVDIEEFIQWLNNELDSTNFNKLIEEFTKVQFHIDIDVKAGCEFCGHSQKLDFRGVENFL